MTCALAGAPPTAEDAPGPRGEEVEQIELQRREWHRPAVAFHRAPARVDAQAGGLGHAFGERATRAPQQRAHARDQFGGAEGLGDVVVSADLEPEEFVALARARGDDENGHLAVATQAARDLEPVEAGQAEVQHHERRLETREIRQRPSAVGRLVTLEAHGLEVLGNDVGDARVVLDDEDLLTHP